MKKSCNFLPKIVLIVFTFSLIACGPGQKIKETPVVKPEQTEPIKIGEKTCEIEKPDWNDIEVGITSEQKVELLSELLSSFKANTNGTQTEDILNAEGSLTGTFKNQFNQTITSLSSKKYSISKDVQNLIVSARALACDILAGLYSGENRLKAENELLKIRSQILELQKKTEQK